MAADFSVSKDASIFGISPFVVGSNMAPLSKVCGCNRYWRVRARPFFFGSQERRTNTDSIAGGIPVLPLRRRHLRPVLLLIFAKHGLRRYRESSLFFVSSLRDVSFAWNANEGVYVHILPDRPEARGEAATTLSVHSDLVYHITLTNLSAKLKYLSFFTVCFCSSNGRKRNFNTNALA